MKFAGLASRFFYVLSIITGLILVLGSILILGNGFNIVTILPIETISAAEYFLLQFSGILTWTFFTILFWNLSQLLKSLQKDGAFQEKLLQINRQLMVGSFVFSGISIAQQIANYLVFSDRLVNYGVPMYQAEEFILIGFTLIMGIIFYCQNRILEEGFQLQSFQDLTI
jgi:hypothetical protein